MSLQILGAVVAAFAVWLLILGIAGANARRRRERAGRQEKIDRTTWT
jgi:hypothetical protein